MPTLGRQFLLTCSAPNGAGSPTASSGRLGHALSPSNATPANAYQP